MISCQFEGVVQHEPIMTYEGESFLPRLRFTVRCDVRKNTQWLYCELMGDQAETMHGQLDRGVCVRMCGARISVNVDAAGRPIIRFIPNSVKVIEQLTLEAGQ